MKMGNLKASFEIPFTQLSTLANFFVTIRVIRGRILLPIVMNPQKLGLS